MLKLLIATITLVLGANALASAADLPPQTVGGAQIGYNYQTPWRVVLGIEVEAEASGVGGNLKITGRHLNEDQPLWGFSRSLRIRVRTVPRP